MATHKPMAKAAGEEKHKTLYTQFGGKRAVTATRELILASLFKKH